MKILLTGASSFTGYWFAKALSESGHHVLAPLKRPLAAYTDGVRAERVRRLAAVADIVENTPFGSDSFLAVLSSSKCDVLCHHAAHVGDYRNPDYDVAAALGENTFNLRNVLRAFVDGGGRRLVLTGTFFEQREGAGNAPLVPFSPYGLSKGLTADVVSYRAREIGLDYAKFVIPHPFGPLEEPRLSAFLTRTWKAGQIPQIKTPDYIRDNIHADLLAAAYVKFVASGADRLNPSGYVGSQGSFVERFAAAMRERTGLACGLEFAVQTDFPEPIMRVNTEPAIRYVEGWDEAKAWDGVAAFYF